MGFSFVLRVARSRLRVQQEMAEFMGDVKPASEKPALGSGEAYEWPLGDAC